MIAEGIEVLNRPAAIDPRPEPSAAEADAAESIAHAVLAGYVLPDVQERGLKAAELCRARLGAFRAADGAAAPDDEELARLLADADTITLLRSSGRIERAQTAAARRVYAAFAAVPGQFPEELILRTARSAATAAGLRCMAAGLAAAAHVDAVHRHTTAIRAARGADRAPMSPSTCADSAPSTRASSTPSTHADSTPSPRVSSVPPTRASSTQSALARRDVASAAIAAALARAAALRLEGRLHRLRDTFDLIAGQVREGRVHSGPLTVPDEPLIRERLSARLGAAADERRTRAARLVAPLLGQLRLDGAPAVIRRPPDPQCLDWLHAIMNDGLYSAGDDLHVQHWLGSDPFGLWAPPAPPPFLAGLDFAELRPEHVAPLLRRLSLTREAPSAADLTPEALERDRGELSVARRTEEQRRWGRAEDSGAPLLDAATRIPRVLYSIWLGEPPALDSEFLDNVGYSARRYAGEIDYVLWTDVPRAAFAEGAEGAERALGERARHLLEWAEANGVLLVNISEVFHRDAPMVCQVEYAAEMSKRRPHGYASASDLVRLEVVERFGGFYVDGDLRLRERFEQAPPDEPFESLAQVIDRVAASELGFTMDPIPMWNNAVNNDVVIGPAHHPAIRLWLEDTRVNYLVPQMSIVGGLHEMGRRLSGMELEAMRYLAPFRTGRVHHKVLSRLDLSGHDLPATQPPILYWSTCTWVPVNSVETTEAVDAEDIDEIDEAEQSSDEVADQQDRQDPEGQDGPPPSADPDEAASMTVAPQSVPVRAREMDDSEVVEILKQCLTLLDWQLRARSGNLYLSAVDRVVRGLPDPDAAWTAMLVALSFMPPSGHAKAERYASTGAIVTSVTYRRRADDGTTFEHVDLPPEAVALLEPHRAPAGWLGAPLSNGGDPVWMLDECVQPVRLLDSRGPTPDWPSAAAWFAEVSVDLLGRPLGLSLGPCSAPAPNADSAAAPEPAEREPAHAFATLPEGRFGLSVAGTPNWSWTNEPALRPDTVAPLLLGAGAAGRPILMAVPYGTAQSAREFAAALADLLGQPVEVIEGPARPLGRPPAAVLVPSTRVPYREWTAHGG